MLKIRLQRIGRKNDPSFRLVLIDSRRAPKSSGFLEILGFYNPRAKSGSDYLRLKKERIEHWLKNGALASGTVHNLLVGQSIVKGPKVNVSSPVKKKDQGKKVQAESLPQEAAKEEKPKEAPKEQ